MPVTNQPNPMTRPSAEARSTGARGPLSRRVRSVLVAAIAALLAGGIAAVPSQAAGQYRVFMCDTPATGAIPTSGLTLGVTTNNVWYGNTCSTPGGHVDVATGLGVLPTAGGAYATLTAPADTTFVGLALRREVGVEAPATGGETAAPAWSIYAGPRDGDHLVEHCNWFLGCRSLTGWAYWSSSAGVSTLHWDAICVGGANTSCAAPAGPNPRVTGWVYAIDVTLSDPFAPERVAWGGSALDGSALTGSKQVTFSASDRGGGIRDARVTLDGVTAGSWSSNVGGCSDQANSSGPDPTTPRFSRADATRRSRFRSTRRSSAMALASSRSCCATPPATSPASRRASRSTTCRRPPS